jgi:hypothetical protein
MIRKIIFLLREDASLISYPMQALIVEEPSSEPRETKPANLVQLKTSTTALR